MPLSNTLNISIRIRSWSYCCRCLGLIMALLLFTAMAWAAPDYKPDNDCVDCHQSLWDKEIQKLYVHPPFSKKQCRKCHIADAGTVESARGFMSDRGVNWLASSRLNTSSHWFSVPSDKIDGDLLIDIQEPGLGTMRKKIVMPSLAKIKRFPNNHHGPKISKVRIKNLQRGLFLHATLAWHTNKESSSQVIYGLGKLNKKTKVNTNLTKEHLAIVPGLRVGKTYNFKVISADLFGNRSQSKLLAFSTARKDIQKGGSVGKIRPDDSRKMSIKYRIFKNKGNILLRFKTNKAIFIGVGVKKKQESHLAGAMKTKGPAPDRHNLKALVETTNRVCEQCHGKYVAKKNHPINIPIGPGMAIPKDFFLLSNGDITCMTCHAAHASNFEYRLVRSSKRELCISCHLAKI